MAMTNAEKQAAFRQRRDARILAMQDQLRNQGGDGEVAKLRRELAQDRQTLGWAQDAIKMLKAQNERLRNGEGEEEPPAGIDEAALDSAHPDHRESYDKAPPNVKTWLNSFANLPRKDAKEAYSLFLCLTAINALPIGKAKPRKRAIT
jgi:hypothetical protein